MAEFYEPSYVARILTVSRLTVNRWIRDGTLPALNIQRDGAKRPTYRIPRAALIDFLCRRGLADPHARSLLK